MSSLGVQTGASKLTSTNFSARRARRRANLKRHPCPVDWEVARCGQSSPAVQSLCGLVCFLTASVVVVLKDENVAGGKCPYTILCPLPARGSRGAVAKRGDAIGVLLTFSNEDGAVGKLQQLWPAVGDTANTIEVPESSRPCHPGGAGETLWVRACRLGREVRRSRRCSRRSQRRCVSACHAD